MHVFSHHALIHERLNYIYFQALHHLFPLSVLIEEKNHLMMVIMIMFEFTLAPAKFG